MTLSRLVVPALAVLVVAAPVLAEQSGPLQCVRETKLQRNSCNAEAKAACEAAFQMAVPVCFGDAAPCAQSCLDTQTSCQGPVHDKLVRCQATCSARETDGRHACESRHQSSSCSHRVRVRGLKCRARCTLEADPETQACATRANDCLKQCAAR